MTKQEFVQLVLVNGKKKRGWLIARVDVEGKLVGIKSYGKYVQIIEFFSTKHGRLIRDSLPIQHTYAHLKLKLERVLECL